MSGMQTADGDYINVQTDGFPEFNNAYSKSNRAAKKKYNPFSS